jgi:hypothetical protein
MRSIAGVVAAVAVIAAGAVAASAGSPRVTVHRFGISLTFPRTGMPTSIAASAECRLCMRQTSAFHLRKAKMTPAFGPRDGWAGTAFCSFSSSPSIRGARATRRCVAGSYSAEVISSAPPPGARICAPSREYLGTTRSHASRSEVADASSSCGRNSGRGPCLNARYALRTRLSKLSASFGRCDYRLRTRSRQSGGAVFARPRSKSAQ